VFVHHAFAGDQLGVARRLRSAFGAASLAFHTGVWAVPETPTEEAPRRLIESPISSANLIETGLGLIVVLTVMLGIAWLFKRYAQVPGIGKGRVQVLGGVSLGAREKAVLLSVEGKRVLVGVAPGRVQALIELDDIEPPQPAFAQQLANANRDGAERRPDLNPGGEPA
jgi:flagellar protein FliO/FliZ